MILRLSLMGLLVIGIAGCGQNSLPPIANWITFDSPDAPYSVLLPTKPKRQDQSPGGVPVVIHLCEVSNDLAVITSSNAIPAGLDVNDQDAVDALLDGAVKKGMARQKATIKEQRDIQLQGKYPCREVTATLKTPNGSEGTIRMRMVLIPGKLIQVLLIGDSKEMQSPQVKECLESLKIKK